MNASMSRGTRKVLMAMASDPNALWHAFDVAAVSRTAKFLVYDRLLRLEEAGMVRSGWDVPAGPLPNRRRHYALTAEGRFAAGLDW